MYIVSEEIMKGKKYLLCQEKWLTLPAVLENICRNYPCQKNNLHLVFVM